MRTFTLTQDMLTMSGQFYPTGHIVAMFPSEQAARDAGQALVRAGSSEDDIFWMPPQVFLEQVQRKVDDGTTALPSPGSEGDTKDRFAELATQGHHGLMIRSPDRRHEDDVMQALHAHQPSYAQKYRRMIIEDIVE